MAGAAIPAPLLLPPMQRGASAVIECSVVPSTGALDIASLTAGSTSRPVHVTATAASVTATHSTSSSAVPAPASLRAMLAPAQARASAAAPAAALAALLSGTGRSGVWFDPAAFDCFLQLGQALKAIGDTEVYVPAGLGALQVAAAPGASAWAATVPLPAAAGTAASDFKLAGCDAPAQLCGISALAAKSMGRVQGSGGKTAAATASRTDCLYEVTWQAAEAAAATQVLPAGAKALWRLAPAEQRQPAAAAAGAIVAAQRLLKSAAGQQAAVQLRTAGAALLPVAGLAGSDARVAAAASLSGLIKTLNQEVPQLSWSSADADSLAPATRSSGSAALLELPAGSAAAADAFGSAARGGARLAPLLLKAAAVEQTGPYHLFPQPRGSLNSLAALPVDAGRKLGAGEVLVEVKAVGINFR